MLKKIEQLAVRTSSYFLTDKDLTAKGVNNSVKYLQIDSREARAKVEEANLLGDKISTRSNDRTLPHLMIRFSQLLGKGKADRFATELLQLSYLSFDTNVGQVKLVAKGRMQDPAKIQDILRHTKDPSVGFSVDGSFSVILRTKLGKSCVDQVVARLSTLSTLCNFANVLKQRGLECRDISFTRVCFKYADDLEAILNFTGPEDRPYIRLELSPNNPHKRVIPLLEETLNDPDRGFESFTLALEYFLPILRAFQSLEDRHCLDFPNGPVIHPRTVDFYRITYPNPH